MRPARHIAVVAAALAAASWASPVRVHPHVFAEASLSVTVNPDGTVGALRHLWRFDDLFSSTVLMEFDRNQNLLLDDDELETVSEVVKGSLAEFNYFQMVTADGKDVPMAAPDRLMANFDDQQLVILFESSPTDALKLKGKLDFGVYDPTFYTAIEFVEDGHMTVEQLPAGCSKAVVRPDPDEAIAQNQQNLTDAFFDDPEGVDLSRIFATRLALDCTENG